MVKRIACVLVCCMVAAMGQTALAQNTETLARIKFEEAKQNYDMEKYDAAAELFREANRLNPNWKLLFNIGQAEAAAKQYGRALTSFQQYLVKGGDEIFVARREEVIAEISRLKLMVGSIELDAPDGAVVFVDDVDCGTAPLPSRLKVTASVRHSLVVKMGDDVLVKKELMISGDEVVQVHVAPSEHLVAAADNAVIVPAPTSPPVSDTAPAEATVPENSTTDAPQKRNGLKRAGWVVTGIGVGALIGFGITGGMALAINNDLEEECKTSSTCESSNSTKLDKQDALATTATALLIAGGVVTATGIILLIASKKKSERLEQHAVVMPAAGPGFAGVGLSWRF